MDTKAGAFDGCVMTNMDALTIPAAGGLDSTALIVGDFSNGNDAVILKGKNTLKDIKGQQVNLGDPSRRNRDDMYRSVNNKDKNKPRDPGLWTIQAKKPAERSLREAQILG